MNEKILRYVNSGLDQTPQGKADFVPWQKRIANLTERNPHANIEEGKIYQGIEIYGKRYGKNVRFYEVLGDITEHIQNQIHSVVLDQNPQLRNKYAEPASLSRLIIDQIGWDIRTVAKTAKRNNGNANVPE